MALDAMTTDAVRERVLDKAEELYYGRGVQAVGMDALTLADRSGSIGACASKR